MTLAGLGKLSPNMVLMGFKNNWKQDLVGLHQYMDVMYSAFDLRLSFAILRCKEGLDFSSQVGSENMPPIKHSFRHKSYRLIKHFIEYIPVIKHLNPDCLGTADRQRGVNKERRGAR